MARQTKKTSARGEHKKARIKIAGSAKLNATRRVRIPKQGTFLGRLSKRLMKILVAAAIIACAIPVLLTFLYLPSSLHPVSTLMLAERLNGNEIRRDWVAFDDISPFVYQSVLMSEDGQYCSHSGVDWDAVNVVIDDVIEGERPRGASTIPMQSVKNLYLWSSRSYIRKVLEVPLALLVDAVWGKRRLMEIYLNIAEWGPGVYGIEAAAQHHFKRSAKRLTRKQAALLAVTLPNPIARNPGKPGKGMRRLARLVEKRARGSGAYIRCLKE